MPTSPPPTTPLTAASEGAPRLVLSSLWMTMMLACVDVDVLRLLARRCARGRARRHRATVGFTAHQRLLTLTSLYVFVPSLMVAGSTRLPRRALRLLSGVVAGAYTTSVVAKAVSDTWVHYLVESGVEIALLVVIGWVAWRWRPAHDAAFVGFVS